MPPFTDRYTPDPSYHLQKVCSCRNTEPILTPGYCSRRPSTAAIQRHLHVATKSTSDHLCEIWRCGDDFPIPSPCTLKGVPRLTAVDRQPDISTAFNCGDKLTEVRRCREAPPSFRRRGYCDRLRRVATCRDLQAR